jgi:hypothetical protein
MKPENLINWGELSRLLAGSRSVITKKRIGKKHEKAIKNLLDSIQKWYEDSRSENGA